ncbi:amidohydrolase [Brotaphodocola sp.]|uniref:amidohydrolase n=1 Tax=Brotaphodocola sp. TaxID=3073577 RepID=UPI003D7E8068
MERDWKELFCWFHRHPETGFQEHETTAKIREILKEEGLTLHPAELETGVIAVVEGKKSGKTNGKTICFRADIDALPIEEKTVLPYVSEHPGFMHACGHDFHTTVALKVASLLNQRKENLTGKIYFVFQPAEEVASGAEYVRKNGNLPEYSEVFGFHVEPTLRPGQVSIQPGSVMAAVDGFRIDIRGKGTHGATPQLGVNPITTAVSVVEKLGRIVPECLSPLHAGVVSVTHLEGGATWNVIPETAFLEGTVRTMDGKDRSRIKEEIYRIAEGMNQGGRVQTKVSWQEGPPAVINDEELCESAKDLAQKCGLQNVILDPAMTGDDFSKFVPEGSDIKGLYIKVGTGPSENLHSDRFKVDVSALDQTVEFLAELLEKQVAR